MVSGFRSGCLVATLCIGVLSPCTTRAQASARDSIPLGPAEIDVPSYAAVAAERYVLLSGPGQHLASADLVSGRVARISRVGSGPGEYRSIGAVFACDSTAGWVDRSLRRIVWISPETGRFVRQLVLPPHVTAVGTPVDIACGDESLWISMESRTRDADAGRVTDTVTVFRLGSGADAFTQTAKFASSDRMVRRSGSLTASLRLPWTAYAQMVPIDAGRVAVVSRRVDSFAVLSSSGARLGSATVSTPPLRLESRERAAVLDSLEATIESEMDASRTDGALRGEARRLHAEMRAAIVFPDPLPRVNRAWRFNALSDEIGVLENGPPGGARSCVTVLSVSGQERGRLCYDWSNRLTHAVLSTGTQLLWLQSNGEGDVWLLRTPLPDSSRRS